jgi:hypothetical protein
MSIDPNAPISTYQDSKAPGAVKRTVGTLLIMLALIFAYYEFRARDLNGWIATKGDVTAQWRKSKGNYWLRAEYLVSGVPHQYEGPKSDVSEFERGLLYDQTHARRMAELEQQLFGPPMKITGKQGTFFTYPVRKRTMIDLRYNPNNPSEAVPLNVVHQNNSIAPWVIFLLAGTAVAGILLLIEGTDCGASRGQNPIISNDLMSH